MPRLLLPPLSLLPAALVLLTAGVSADSNRTWLQRYAQMNPFKQKSGIDHCEAWYATGKLSGQYQTVWCQMETNFLVYTHCCEYTNAIGWTECCYFVQDWFLVLVPILLLATSVYCFFCVRMCVDEQRRVNAEDRAARAKRQATRAARDAARAKESMPLTEMQP